ncbi:pyruvate dehydrogenase E1, beta subunit [Ascosphaera pollenicola]|nr:pyruvate dehydrogenase E1, beta subunit [Ascosphaera pollenicola]
MPGRSDEDRSALHQSRLRSSDARCLEQNQRQLFKEEMGTAPYHNGFHQDSASDVEAIVSKPAETFLSPRIKRKLMSKNGLMIKPKNSATENLASSSEDWDPRDQKDREKRAKRSRFVPKTPDISGFFEIKALLQNEGNIEKHGFHVMSFTL